VLYSCDYYASIGTGLNLSDIIDSKPFEEDLIGGTPIGEFSLSYAPYIESGVINDLNNFYHKDGIYIYNGEPNTVLAISNLDMQTRYKIKPSELTALYQYLYLDNVLYGNTNFSQSSYEPITIFVDGVKAKNITDYLGGNNPTISMPSNNNTFYDYIHQDNKILFGTNMNGKNIHVKYNVLAKHIALDVVFKRSFSDASLTPVLKDATLLIKTRSR
jgi:hypothetical protein